MKSFAGAIVEEDRAPNRIPNRRVTHAPRTAQREVQPAGRTMPPQDLFVELKRPGQQLSPNADRMLHVASQFGQTCRLQSAAHQGGESGSIRFNIEIATNVIGGRADGIRPEAATESSSSSRRPLPAVGCFHGFEVSSDAKSMTRKPGRDDVTFHFA